MRVHIRDAVSELPIQNALVVFHRYQQAWRNLDPRMQSFVFARVGRREEHCFPMVTNAQGFVERRTEDIGRSGQNEVLICDYCGRVVGRVGISTIISDVLGPDRQPQEMAVENVNSKDLVVWIPKNLFSGLPTTGVFPGPRPSSVGRFPSLKSQFFSAGSEVPSLGDVPQLFRVLPVGRICSMDPSEIELLVDNVVAWNRVAQVIASARRSIEFVSLAVLPGTRLTQTGPTIGALLAEKVRSTPSLYIRMLIDHGPSGDSVYNAWMESIGSAPARFKLLMPQSNNVHQMHNKFIVADDVLIVIGSPMDDTYLEGRGHFSERAVAHDVSLGVSNSFVVNEFRRRFYTEWSVALCRSASMGINISAEERARGYDYSSCVGSSPPELTDVVNGFPGSPGVMPATIPLESVPSSAGRILAQTNVTSEFCSWNRRTVMESYVRALLGAERYVYIENQYLTHPAVVSAVTRALELKPTLKLIVLTNAASDLPFHRQATMLARRRLFMSAGAGRVGMYTLWRIAVFPGAQPRLELAPVYVHSKFCLIDDRWLTVGSANLNQISLEGIPGPWVDATQLLTSDPGVAEETNIALWSDQPHSKIVGFRNDLWAEYGVVTESVYRPSYDPFAAWRERAQWAKQNLASGGALRTQSCFPLPMVSSLAGLRSPRDYVMSVLRESQSPQLNLDPQFVIAAGEESSFPLDLNREGRAAEGYFSRESPELIDADNFWIP